MKKIFTGPTAKQYDRINKRKKIETQYIEFVYANPGLTIEQYKEKYKELNS